MTNFLKKCALSLSATWRVSSVLLETWLRSVRGAREAGQMSRWGWVSDFLTRGCDSFSQDPSSPHQKLHPEAGLETSIRNLLFLLKMCEEIVWKPNRALIAAKELRIQRPLMRSSPSSPPSSALPTPLLTPLTIEQSPKEFLLQRTKKKKKPYIFNLFPSYYLNCSAKRSWMLCICLGGACRCSLPFTVVFPSGEGCWKSDCLGWNPWRSCFCCYCLA